MLQRARLGRVLGRREGKCIAQGSVEAVEFGSMMFCSGTDRVVQEQKCLTKFK